MLLRDEIRSIVAKQKKTIQQKPRGTLRTQQFDLSSNHIIIISGVRRSGKSTILTQLYDQVEDKCFVNFEDPALYSFTVEDFATLTDIYKDKEYFFFDEIQNVDEWERPIRYLHDQGKKIIITGSNASLLSKELGTRLTGRHLTHEIFPFSYNEFLKYADKRPGEETFARYIEKGGFPENIHHKNPQILQELLQDILARDILVRHNVKNEKSLKQLAQYLLTNVGKPFSLTKLKNTFQIGSVNTVKKYISYLENSYLLFTTKQFSWSHKKQIRNPNKIYSIDHAFSDANSASFSEDKGRLLENLVYIHLRHRHKKIFYYQDDNECDFIVKENNDVTKAVQVTWKLHKQNKQRELQGIQHVTNKFNLDKGVILTYDQEDTVGNIDVIPVWKWLTTKK